MILYIDTTDFNSVMFALAGEPGLKKTYKIDSHKSHETLSKLDDFIKKSKIKTSDIKKIIINKGPGSFTGVRVGISHAQALGFAWQIPIKALSKEQFDKVMPTKKRS